jgi:hypothetical protein
METENAKSPTHDGAELSGNRYDAAPLHHKFIRVNELPDGKFEVALHARLAGRLFRIASYPTRLEAVNRATLEEHERGVPLIVGEVQNG